MSRSLPRAASLVTAFLVAACAKPSAPSELPAPRPPALTRPFETRPAPSNEDWLRVRPPPLPVGSVPLPVVEERRLASGMRVLVVERHDFPSVDLAFVLDRGNCNGRAGARIFAHALRSSRRQERSKKLDDVRRLGVFYASSAWMDIVTLSATLLPPLLPSALEHLAPMFFAPELSAEDIGDSRQVLKAQLATADARTANLRDRALYGAVFGRAGYGAVLVDPGEVDAEPDAQVRAFAEAVRSPRHVSVVAVGDTTADRVVALLERFTGGLPRAEVDASTCVSGPAATSDGVIHVVDVPGAAQSQVIIGAPGVPWGDADAAALAVLSTALGASLSKRLDMKRRVEHGLTYGVQMTSKNFRVGGLVEVTATVEAGPASEALAKLRAELDRVGVDPLEEGELRRAVSLELPAFRSHKDITMSLVGIAADGLPADTIARHEQALRRVTSADVVRVAKKYLGASRQVVTIIGDAARVVPALGGRGIGPVEVVR